LPEIIKELQQHSSISLASDFPLEVRREGTLMDALDAVEQSGFDPCKTPVVWQLSNFP
jgi:hypothetical protein